MFHITEKLPPRDKLVLLYHKRRKMWKVGKLEPEIPNFPTYWCEPNGGAVELLLDPETGKLLEGRITHWTDLPPNPKRKEN